MCLPPLEHSPATVFDTPSPTPHLEHLPNFHVCAPPEGQQPLSDSIAELAACLCVDASPGARLVAAVAPPSGERHFGHSFLLCSSSHS
eukprot:4512185-Prymnesium_polylepis.2